MDSGSAANPRELCDAWLLQKYHLSDVDVAIVVVSIEEKMVVSPTKEPMECEKRLNRRTMMNREREQALPLTAKT
jgi:hypothetical protein